MTEPDTRQRLYLDHASTSWPKHDDVIEAMTSFMRDCGASASRGHYAAARQAGLIVDRVRRRLAEVIGAPQADCVSFHAGCTAALNVAIHGLLGDGHVVDRGSHIIASAAEHNAVLRPLNAAAGPAGVGLEILPIESSGTLDPRRLADSIRDQTRLVAVTHASNVTGVVAPLEAIASEIHRINRSRSPQSRVLLLCDAAQTFGYLPIDVSAIGIDVLAAPAHKGSGGPVGIGMLYLDPSLHASIRPILQGGSGQDGLSETMPTTMPEKLEPGTLNVPAIAGWGAALDRFEPSPDRLAELARYLHLRLSEVDGLTIFGPPGPLPIASFDFGPMLPPAEAAAVLDSEFGIDVRSGYHCAAAIHPGLGSTQAGTVRVSCGKDTTLPEIDRLAAACEEIASSLR